MEPITTFFLKQTYKIAEDGKSITCLVCGNTSHNIKDVAQLYCANCKAFHMKV